MIYYQEPDIVLKVKSKQYQTCQTVQLKKDLEHATGVDTSDLAVKTNFIALKAEVDKLVIYKIVNVPTSLNNLKTKIVDLDVGKLKTAPVDLKKLSDVVDNEVVKNIKFNTLKTKTNNVEYKIPDA